MTRSTLLIIDGEVVSTWGEFVAVNGEMECGELQEIADQLENEGRYDGGGGACAEFTVELAS